MTVTLRRGVDLGRRKGGEGRQREETLPRQEERLDGLARRISGRNTKGGKRSGDTRLAPELPEGQRPTRDDLLRFVSENPDRSGKRDIARAFSLKGEDRVWLKDTLRDLEDEGLLEKSRKRLIRPGALPHVVVLDIFSRDPDGGLLARPTERAGDDTRTKSAGCRKTLARRKRTGSRYRRPRAGQGIPDRRPDRPRLHRAGDEDIRQAQGSGAGRLSRRA